MLPFDFFIPTKVHFGTNIWRDALKKERYLLQKRLMVVTTGRSLYRLGYLEALFQELRCIRDGGDIVVYDRITANPKLAEIKSGIELAKERRIEVVLGFGGGSAIDAAKAIAAGAGTTDPIERLLFDGKAPGENTPVIIAMPTTAGTGSELSKGAIISSLERTVKTGIRGEHIYPYAAIVDPIFTYKIPYEVTMETGFDVLAHAIESYVSKKASDFSRLLSEEAIRMVSEALPTLASDLGNKKARAQMSYASMLMGINLGNVGTALPHRMQYPIGAHTDTSHGAGLLALYPAWLKHEYGYAKDLLDRVMLLLMKETCKSEMDCQRIFEQFLQVVQIRKNLQQLGIKKEQFSLLASEVTGNILNDPAAAEARVIEKIYQESME